MRSKKVVQIHTIRKIAAFVIPILLGSLLLSGCNSQEPEVYRVGILSGLDFLADNTEGFKAGMAELGYIEGEDIIYDVQSTDFDMDTYRSILQQFVDDEVDLIFTFPTEASIEAKAITEGTDIPVVFSFAQIEGLDLVDSVREPGGNITGVRLPGPDVAIFRLDIMKQMIPDVTRILVPYQLGYPIVEPQLEALRPAAEAAGITLIEAAATDGADLESLLQAQVEAGEANIDAILFVLEPLHVHPDAIAVLAAFSDEYQIPVAGDILPTDEGYRSLFQANVVPFNSGKQAATLADNVFKGTSPGTLPVISADIMLTLNSKEAEELGLEVPEELLALASNIIR